MTIALVIAVAVAAVALAGCLGVRWRARSAAGRAADRVELLTTRLREAVELLEESEAHRRAAEVKAAAADTRARTAEQKATDAERRSGDAEKRVADALRRAEEASRAGAVSAAASTTWDLERLRMEREWTDVAGPGVELPLPLEGGMAAVLATELALIRETMGTPSELEVTGPLARWEPTAVPAGPRVAVEMLRRMARSGEEMVVRLGPGTLVVTQAATPADERPDLSELQRLCPQGGMSLESRPDEGSWTVQLSVISPPGG